MFIDTLDLASVSHREKYVNGLRAKLPQADAEAIDSELLRLADVQHPETGLAGDRDEENDAADLLEQMPEDVRTEAKAMLCDPLLIKYVIDDVAALGVAGERELTATVYLIGTSRLLDRPLAGIVQGPSSSGKSHLIEKTACLFPPEAIIHAAQMMPQALFHMKPGSLSHRFIVAGERSRTEDDERIEATRALREMLSAGKLTKLMPVKVEGNRIETVRIEQDGPIAYVESTTLAKVFDEDANRCLQLNTDEQPKQTRRIITTLAASYCSASSAVQKDQIIARHYALQRMLRRLPVVIPFAERLGTLFTSDRVEARRAFPQVMSMIQSVALLYQRQRQTDAEGRLIAIAEDYQVARRLLVKPMARLIGGRLSDPARRFHDRLSQWATDVFTSNEAKKKEPHSRSSVYGWLTELHEAGLVEMVAPSRGRSPATWRLTSASPESALESLPTLEEVFPDSTWTPGRKTQLVGRS
jgi:hypothetical protein